jgi:photosystem II stability/assembly factor-like uncharacterized protein
VEVPTLFLMALSWALQQTQTTASLRGLAAVNDRIVWASGTGGTFLRTTDGGATWTPGRVPGAEKLDFRDVHAVDAQTAYLMASGTGAQSRIYKTVDGGRTWTLQFTNPDTDGFFDAIAFWDAERGIVMGDSVGGRIAVFTTADGGAHWERREGPAALPKEGGFAASGTCLIATGSRDAWLGSTAARIFHSTDAGRTWTVVETSVRHDSASAGIFSLAFSDEQHGIAVGGDYTKPESTEHNIAVTSDGGRTWTEPTGHPPSGFRSAVTWVPARKAWIALGTNGADISRDGGVTWERFSGDAFNAVSFAPSGMGWAAGPKGAVAVLRPDAR